MQEIETIRQELERLLIDPYPENIFAKIKMGDFNKLQAFWEKETGRPIDALSADYGRIFRKGETPIIRKLLEILAQLEAKLSKPIDVEKVARAVYDEHYKDSPKQGRDRHWKIEDVKCFWGGMRPSRNHRNQQAEGRIMWKIRAFLAQLLIGKNAEMASLCLLQVMVHRKRKHLDILHKVKNESGGDKQYLIVAKLMG